MAQTPPSKIRLPPLPSTADFSDNAIADSPATSTLSHRSPLYLSSGGPSVPPPRRSARQSFATLRTRRDSRGTVLIHDDVEDIKLPTLVPGIRPAYSTPLPGLPMAVLSIAMLSELLSANLCTPFILKMVEGFYLADGYEKNSETEAEVGLWTGNLISVFFITQFFTSLLWSSIADRHGRRAVIVASMAGSAIALIIFGTSESVRTIPAPDRAMANFKLPEAICIRLIQGIFGGAVGVFRGSIRDITDDTNASRAYAVLGFSWGFGGVMGPILGGNFESPAQNWPGTFLANFPLFQSFPYILPTILGSMILFAGAIMACFLSWDGGVRGGTRIALPAEKDDPLVPEIEGTPLRSVSPAPSHATAVPSVRGYRDLLSPRDTETAAGGAGYPGLSQVPHARRDSRASLGTAYGYGGIRSKHPTLAARAALDAARRVSTADGGFEDEGDEEEQSKPLNFAQKLLLANEENTFNINDLWVSAAVAQDSAVFDEDEDYENETEYEDGDRTDNAIESNNSTPQPSPSFAPQGSVGRAGGRAVSGRRLVSTSLQRALPGHRLSVSHGGRRFSTASGNMPAIFANTGLRTPPASIRYDASPNATTQEEDPFFAAPPPRGMGGGLSVIAERPTAAETTPLSPSGQVMEKQASSWQQLPKMMILQYGLLAFHNTTHDQVFLSFLTTQYKSGGIGLNPANFSFLIAIMCLFQLVYQFWLYPRLGPPLGKFSHLQMFRLGCCLYIPSYMALPLLRAFASPDQSGGFLIMTLLTLVTAVRYCGGTLAYTSVMVLVNAMSPPNVVGLANGLAQSTVSFARFFGPVIGGALWSSSINGNPQGYAHGFYICTMLCIVQVLASFLIR